MKMMLRVAAGPLLALATIASGCSSLSSGPPKVVLNENVCTNVHFLNLKFNKTNRVILDNRKFTPGQTAMTVTLTNFPVIVQGEVPANSVIGDKVSTIVLRTKAGEQSSVDLVPTFTGTYKATCSATIAQSSSVRAQTQDIDFQIK
jgi:hypothetical protein